MSLIENVRIIDFPRACDPRGNLTFVQSPQSLPYEIRRVYWLSDVPYGSVRGGHSHRECAECLVAMSGSFNVVVADGISERTFTLKSPYQGLLIVPGIWRELNDFSAGSVCMVMASDIYKEDDYIRDYNTFLAECKQ